jgi:flavin reductase (DIM6/NTAB) family NADH-FMN oxidoreductase RutF
MLGENNLELARKMAEDHSKRFLGSDWEFSEFGLPVFKEATAVLFVKVREFHAIEQNAVFITEVVSGKLGTNDKALLYNQRSYFAPADTPL